MSSELDKTEAPGESKKSSDAQKKRHHSKHLTAARKIRGGLARKMIEKEEI